MTARWMFAEQVPSNHSVLNVEFGDVEFPLDARLASAAETAKQDGKHIYFSNGRHRMVLQENQGQISITNPGNKGSPTKKGHWGIEFIFIHYNFKYAPKVMYFFHLYLEALEVHKCDYFQCQIFHVPSSSISEQMEEHFSLFFSM